MKIISSAFEAYKFIPSKYTCDGKDINPPLEIIEAPPEAKSLVLFFDDIEAPSGVVNHWLVWNINPGVSFVEEDSLPKGAIPGKNGFGKIGYSGPCPPEETIHHYQFKLYALDTSLDIEIYSDKQHLENIMEGHIIDQDILIVFYKRQKR